MNNNISTLDRKKAMLLVLSIELIALLLSIRFSEVIQVQQAFSTFTLFGLPTLIYGINSKHRDSLKLRTQPGSGVLSYGLLVLFIISIFPASNFLLGLNWNITLPELYSALEESLRTNHIEAVNFSETLMRVDSTWLYLLNILVMAVVAATCEELFFRGMLQGYISKRLNIHITIIVVSIVFSALHFDFYGFIPRFILSILYGYIFHYTKSLWSTIITHFVNNALYVTIVYVQYKYNALVGLEDFGSTYVVGIAAMAISISIIFIMRQRMLQGKAQ